MPVLWGAVLAAMTGCAPTQHQLSERANRIAQPSGLTPSVVATEQFHVMTYARLDDPQQPLRVYLEGDGKAWISRTRISLNPTPHNPLALRLAALDQAPNVVYIARPCQYVALTTEHHCSPHYWSRARYSPAIVAAIDEVISDYVSRSGAAAGIELVGYSGGGALAVLVALKRQDVMSLRTVAANLDTDLFTRLHQVTPLRESLNPADFAGALQHLPQRHYVGGEDTVIPASIAHSYWQAAGAHDCVQVRPLSGVTHRDGWQDRWSALLDEALPCVSGTVAKQGFQPQTLAETDAY
ncbi:alpha/beta hydrolase [Aestuariicella hydrocarbonica]|uniref:Alpha/beta hydrolase n=2 Tax=Pseudomaricurvus hydrocarbonicus TaxID=1470433 RepID=A0A9E5MQB7_9GAMM|nr:alpha/beta hydrolase [Aestuariicella hydrocarbonica]